MSAKSAQCLLRKIMFPCGIPGTGVEAQTPETVTLRVPSSGILNSHSSPYQIVPDPGPGKFVQVLYISYTFNYGTSQYVFSGHTYGVTYTGKTSVLMSVMSNAVIEGTVSKTVMGALQTVGPTEDIEGLGLIFYTKIADPTGGDGYLDIHITYNIIDL